MVCTRNGMAYGNYNNDEARCARYSVLGYVSLDVFTCTYAYSILLAIILFCGFCDEFSFVYILYILF